MPVVRAESDDPEPSLIYPARGLGCWEASNDALCLIHRFTPCVFIHHYYINPYQLLNNGSFSYCLFSCLPLSNPFSHSRWLALPEPALLGDSSSDFFLPTITKYLLIQSGVIVEILNWQTMMGPSVDEWFITIDRLII